MRNLIQIAMAVVCATSAFAGQYIIDFGGSFGLNYAPDSINVHVGDTIIWQGDFSAHPLESTSVPVGAAPFGNATGVTYSYVAQVAGAYTYHCTVHFAQGMKGKFRASLGSDCKNVIIPAGQTITVSDDFYDSGSPSVWDVFTLSTSTTGTYATDYDIFVRNPNGTKGSQVYEGFYDYDLGFNRGYYDWANPSTRMFNPALNVNASDGFIHEARFSNGSASSVSVQMCMLIDYNINAVSSTFTNVYNILQTNCTAGCHTGGSPAGGLNLSGTETQVYSAIVEVAPSNSTAAAKGDKLIDKGYPERSFLLRKIAYGLSDDLQLTAGEGNNQPNGQPKLNDYDIELVRQWILQGAPQAGTVVDYQQLVDYYTIGGIPKITRPAAPTTGQGIQIHFGPVFLAPSEELEYTRKYNPLFAQALETSLLSVVMSWEVSPFHLRQFQPGTEQNWNDGFLPVSGSASIIDRDFIGLFLNDGQIALPSGTAFFWDGNTVFDLYVHVKNYSVTEILPCELYLNVYTNPRGASTIEMESRMFNNASLFIPNNGQDITFTDDIISNGETWNIWSLTTHTHKYGVDFDIFERNANGSLGVQVYEGFYDPTYSFNQGYYDWMHPAFRFFDPLLQVDMTNGLIHKATYRNNGPSPATFGYSFDDEMMVTYVQYTETPANKIPLSGGISSEIGSGVRSAAVQLSGTESQDTTTAIDGSFLFDVTPGGNYTIIPEKNNDFVPNNGITTLDLLLVRKHVLQMQMLSSPYKIIAADVNSSGTITSTDILFIRSMILQINTAFPNGKLWAFVPDDYVFTNPQNPFPYQSLRTYSNISSGITDADFIGMKLGDVNNSWDPNTPKAAAVGSMQVALGGYSVLPGNEITVPVKVRGFNNITGYQFTLSWNPDVLALQEITNKSLKGYFGEQKIKEGYLTTSWNDEMTKAISLDDNTVLFELKFKATGPDGISSEIKINSELTAAEAYNENLDLLEIAPTNGIVKVGDGTSLNTQHSTPITLTVQPNPFSNSTQITFTLPKDENVSLAIYDILGKEVMLLTGVFTTGEHRITWDGRDGSGKYLTKGLYHLRMKTAELSQGLKLILTR